MPESIDVPRPARSGGVAAFLAITTIVLALVIGVGATLVTALTAVAGQWSDVVQAGVVAVLLIAGAVLMVRRRRPGPWMVGAGALLMLAGGVVYLVSEATDAAPFNLDAVTDAQLVVVIVLLLGVPALFAALALCPPTRRWVAAGR